MAVWQPARWVMLLVAIGCAAGTARAIASYATATRTPPSPDASAKVFRNPVRLADATDAWLESLRKPSFWRKNRSDAGRERREVERPRGRSRSHRASHGYREEENGEPVRREWTPSHGTRHPSTRHRTSRWSDGNTYRTMCVRLCDGYYWPVSFSATRGEFARDSKTCERSCDSPVALHVYRNPGEESEEMVDLQGRPYTMLDSAFRYRASYNAACKCRPHPWEEAARQRHVNYKVSAQAHAGATEKR